MVSRYPRDCFQKLLHIIMDNLRNQRAAEAAYSPWYRGKHGGSWRHWVQKDKLLKVLEEQSKESSPSLSFEFLWTQLELSHVIVSFRSVLTGSISPGFQVGILPGLTGRCQRLNLGSCPCMACAPPQSYGCTFPDKKPSAHLLEPLALGKKQGLSSFCRIGPEFYLG